ncbi:MAG: hypothetical protein GQ523_10565 [Methanophagales archaeon]|nr:hypothetical protein [Methanophagales archaeon]
MKKDDINKALWEYYRVTSEHSIHVGTQLHQSISLSIMCMALFLTFTGLLMTQKDKIISSNWSVIGIVIVVIILFLLFILSIGYYLYLRIHLHNIFGTAMKIEELQRDILFDKVRQEELEKRFKEFYPFLNASKYEIKWKSLFRRW